jgi:hypothetical protein
VEFVSNIGIMFAEVHASRLLQLFNTHSIPIKMRKNFMNLFQIFIIRSRWRNFYMETWEKLLSKAMDYLNEVSLPLDKEGNNPSASGAISNMQNVLRCDTSILCRIA